MWAFPSVFHLWLKVPPAGRCESGVVGQFEMNHKDTKDTKTGTGAARLLWLRVLRAFVVQNEPLPKQRQPPARQASCPETQASEPRNRAALPENQGKSADFQGTLPEFQAIECRLARQPLIFTLPSLKIRQGRTVFGPRGRLERGKPMQRADFQSVLKNEWPW